MYAIHIRELENHRKNTRRKRGCRCFAVAPSPPAVAAAAFHRHFLLPPGVCVESICNSLSLSRVCALLRCTLRFQPRPTRREIGNLKSKLRTAACRAHPRPSFSRITLDHRWSSRAWYQTRGCVIELGKWNDSAYRALFVSRIRDSRPFFLIFFPVFFLRAKRKVCSARYREMINPTKRTLHGK